MVEIKWGERSDLEKYSKSVSQILSELKEDTIVSVINEEHVSDDDLESTWLIENHIKENPRNRKNIDSELGKLALYVLNIPSNFSIGKSLQTEKLLLNESDYWIEDMMNM